MLTKTGNIDGRIIHVYELFSKFKPSICEIDEKNFFFNIGGKFCFLADLEATTGCILNILFLDELFGDYISNTGNFPNVINLMKETTLDDSTDDSTDDPISYSTYYCKFKIDFKRAGDFIVISDFNKKYTSQDVMNFFIRAYVDYLKTIGQDISQFEKSGHNNKLNIHAACGGKIL